MCCILSFTLKTKCGLLRSFVLFSNVFYFFSKGPFCNGQADFERDRQGLLYNLNQLSHAVAEKKVQDRYDGRNFDRDRSDRQSTHWRQESKREAVNSFERHPGLDLQGQGIILKTRARTSHNENWHSHNFFFCFWVFEKSWDIQVSKSDSRLFDDFFDGFHVSTPAGSAHRYGPKDRTSPDRSDRAERSARMRKALEKTAAAGAWSGPRLEKFVRQTPGTMELRQVGVFRFRIGRWRFVKFRYLDRAFTRQELLTQESREASTTSTHAVNEASSCSRWIHLVDFEIVYGWPKSSLERRRHAGLLSLAAPDLSADAGTT